MKYYKTSKFTKMVTSTGFIAMSACLLIAIGAITWFALSKNNALNEKQNKNNSELTYPDSNESYNENVDITNDIPDDEVTDVDDKASEIPYSQPQSNQQSTPQKPTYVLPITGNISKGYSITALQYSVTYNDMRLHTGVDILCEKNSKIKSVGSGKVKSISDDAKLGKVIVIEYSDNITVKYCGMGSVDVKENDNVAVGDVIGTSGEIPSECADKPHIHIEVFVNDQSVSPLEALGLE